MKLSIIIVNYNGGKVLKPCLTSVYRETQGISFEVILVDNDSTDGSVDMVEKDFPSVRIVRNGANRGFAAANNIALRRASGEYVLLLNADTEILDRAIEKTIEFMEDKPTVGVVGCKLLFADGTRQPSVRGYPTVLEAFLNATFLYLLLPRNVVIRGKGISHFDGTKAEEIDWVIGAYFMTRRSVIDKVGLLDEQFWLYGEETDFAQRAKDAGFESWYIPHAVVIHHWGMVTEFNLRLIVWMHLGRWLYVDKHVCGLRKYVILGLRCMGAALRVIVYPIVGCLTLNKRWFAKGYYFGVALFKMLTDLRRYDHRNVGEVIPWTEYI